MIIITAVENRGGMLFNHRRVSRDKALRERITSLSALSSLWMNSFSARQFIEGLPANARISETFLDEAGESDFCFVEDKNLLPYADHIEAVYLFQWNRDYPSDFKLDFIPSEHGFQLTGAEDFAGTSHEKISVEVWEHAEPVVSDNEQFCRG